MGMSEINSERRKRKAFIGREERRREGGKEGKGKKKEKRKA